MKAVILAGGLGTRISEESHLKPKPMIEVGDKPIIWHIMKIYSAHGVNDFVICCGYKGYVIKEYFANYFLHTSDVTIDMTSNSMQIHRKSAEPWTVTLINTGETTATGGRLKRIAEHVVDEDFCFTYGDGVSDINLSAAIAFHREHKRYATMTSVQPPGRFGSIAIEGDNVVTFKEKPLGDKNWINGGFFVLSPEVFSYIEGDDTAWEEGPLEQLARDGQLKTYRHRGFWQPMDTLRDKNRLEALWAEGSPPWKVW
ncbi:MAG: glucose-1-phosphate cytidylyltransferase [Pseudomonadota bacterium]